MPLSSKEKSVTLFLYWVLHITMIWLQKYILQKEKRSWILFSRY